MLQFKKTVKTKAILCDPGRVCMLVCAEADKPQPWGAKPAVSRSTFTTYMSPGLDWFQFSLLLNNEHAFLL